MEEILPQIDAISPTPVDLIFVLMEEFTATSIIYLD
jgi:hypothetical protein